LFGVKAIEMGPHLHNLSHALLCIKERRERRERKGEKLGYDCKFTVTNVAYEMGVDRSTLYRWFKKGRLEKLMQAYCGNESETARACLIKTADFPAETPEA
jgi:hypothetical protein